MKRLYAVLVTGLALAMVWTAAPAAAAPMVPLRNQQAIDFVIARALAQRGVPYTYGGGDANGPTKGVRVEATPTAPALGQAPVVAPSAIPGLGLAQTGPTNPNLGQTPDLTTPGLGQTPSPAVDPSANVVGFDASGLIVYAFAGVGLKLPRSSGQQYAVGRKVTPAMALPGDLIFYGPDGAQSVALFVGNGLMLEATDPAVTVSKVRTTNMTPYLVRIIE